MYTVKQLSDLAGVSVRTLHYYDEIGLLAPTATNQNGYRSYDENALLRLQQVLFYREMGVGLLQIKAILDDPAFDPLEALQSHRAELEKRISRLQQLIHTVDTTLMHLGGEALTSRKQLFTAFSEEKQRQYEREIAEKYGESEVQESVRNWYAYSEEKKATIQAEGSAIYHDLTTAMQRGIQPNTPEIAAIMARWHQHLRHFYEPTPEILRGLGHMYNQHPDFVASFRQFHPDLPPYLERAVEHYVDTLAAE